MELEVQLDKKTMQALKKIAKKEGKSVEEIAADLLSKGMKNFLGYRGPLRSH